MTRFSSMQVLRKARDAQAIEGNLVDSLKAFTKVKASSRFVLSAGLNDRARSVRLAFEKAADKGGCEAAAEVIGIDDQPVYVDRGSVDTPGDRSGKSSVNDRAEERFAARLELFERFPKGWNAFRADEVGLNSVRLSLQVQNCARGLVIADF